MNELDDFPMEGDAGFIKPPQEDLKPVDGASDQDARPLSRTAQSEEDEANANAK